MGLDARIYIEGIDQISDAFEVEAGHYLSSWIDDDGRRYYLSWEECCEPAGPAVSIEGFERYFSPAYPRGDWPMIRAAIIAAQRHYPGRVIRYGSDHDHTIADAAVVTPELIAQLDAAWLATPVGE